MTAALIARLIDLAAASNFPMAYRGQEHDGLLRATDKPLPTLEEYRRKTVRGGVVGMTGVEINNGTVK